MPVVSTDDIAAMLCARGLDGPVLVVADDDAITTLAPAWADAFAAAGITHRVVVAGVDTTAAAAGLGARVVVAAGSAAASAAAHATAHALGIPAIAFAVSVPDAPRMTDARGAPG